METTAEPFAGGSFGTAVLAGDDEYDDPDAPHAARASMPKPTRPTTYRR
jgi:hypothetical protein